MLGSIGFCDRVFCCYSFLGVYAPVSIKMAKDQNLSLIPAQISDICGRLLCCLKYENDVYVENRKNGCHKAKHLEALANIDTEDDFDLRKLED